MAETCRLCGSADVRFLFGKNSFTVLECPVCGAAFVSNPPRAEELSKHYSMDYFKGNREKFGYVDYMAEEPFMAESFERKIDRLNEASGGGGKILDVGCATGLFLKMLGKRWEKHGVEISSDILSAQQAADGLAIWNGDFLRYPENQAPFDVITLWDVLDHVLDPKETLHKARALLKPGGLLALNVGDRESLLARILGKRWHIYIPPTHLTFFSRRSLERLLESSGFRLLDYQYEGKWVPLSLCLFRLSYIFPHAFFKKAYEWSQRSSIGRVKVYINLRDVMTLYAVRA